MGREKRFKGHFLSLPVGESTFVLPPINHLVFGDVKRFFFYSCDWFFVVLESSHCGNRKEVDFFFERWIKGGDGS